MGALQAGADVRLMVDFDAASCRTLRMNEQYHNGVVWEEDVSDDSVVTGESLRRLAQLSSGDCLVVVGGPPCQPFSKAAYWTDPGDEAAYRRARARGEPALRPSSPIAARPDSRRSLVQEYWRLVQESDADGFLFENVPSIMHARNRPVLEEMLVAAGRAGYKTTLVKANAAEYGVPQRRVRVFVLGSRLAKPTPPERTHTLNSEGGLLPAVTAGEVLSDFESDEFFEPEEVVTGRWAEHLRAIPPGQNYKFHTAWAGHPDPTFETETRFWSFLLKLDPGCTSWTIPANPGPWVGPFHWDSRRLRTAELAALQGFPKGYHFSGNRRERVRQIGNAVPPPLARRMVEQVLKALNLDPTELLRQEVAVQA